jgi:hypothetical protein
MSAKTEAVQMLNELPDDASLEDIQYHLYVLEKVKLGIARAEQHGDVDHLEERKRLSRWLENRGGCAAAHSRGYRVSSRRPTA